MAELIPNLNSCLSKMTNGEKRFARRLQSHLEDDYLCWFEIPVGKKRRYTDFIILHPNRGILLLEVKDWKLENIERGDRLHFDVHTNTGIKSLTNPVEQARQCAYMLNGQLSRDPQLVHQEGQHKGKILCPWGYGAVFSNITRSKFDQIEDAYEIIPEHMVIFQDEMTESVSVEDFQERLWQMFNQNFNFRQLTVPQIDRIRWHIFPEIRIIQKSLFDKEDSSEEVEEQIATIEDSLKVFDLQQEKVARNLGEGHRIIHGVSGSGKTLILAYRAEHLASNSVKPILILCYNITLAAKLNAMMRERGVDHKVNVRYFHDWCSEQLRTYNVSRPPPNSEKYYDKIVENLINAVDKNQIPRSQYDAVLIDEGHDFEPSWLKLVTQMIDDEKDSLLLLYDDTQSIYDSKKNLNFTLSSVGIKARGRTTILKINYRNPKEILELAFDFAKEFVEPHQADEDGVPIISPESPEFNTRSGPVPELIKRHNIEDEGDYISKAMRAIRDRDKLAWSDMCVIYHAKWVGNIIKERMELNKIPFQHLIESRDKKTFDPSIDRVKLMTIHSSKGLEFQLVAIPAIGHMTYKKENIEKDAKLLYVAMTRSLNMLLLTHSKDSPFTKILYSRIQEQKQKAS